MATLVKNYNWQENVLTGEAFNWESATIKVMLLDDTAAPHVSTDEYIDDVSANEVSGSNYTAGGATIGNISVSRSSGVSTVDGDDVTWSQHASGFEDARYAVIYQDTGTPGTSMILMTIDLTTDRGNVNGDFTLQWNAAGLFTQE